MAEERNRDIAKAEQEELQEDVQNAAEESEASADAEVSDEAAEKVEEDEEPEAGEGEPEDGEGKETVAKGEGFFKKKKKDKRDEQIEELQEKLKRQMAEFDNYRKRTEKEKSQMFDMGARTMIEKFLPVIDNFERGLAAVPQEQKEDAFVTGMDKVYKQMLAELENVGVAPIETDGREFDPELHNAVMQVESGELESGTIAQELQKGYTYKDTVIRHSMVSVVS